MKWLVLLTALLAACAGKKPPAKGDFYYTCSMHPQVRMEGPGACPICKMALIPMQNLPDSGQALRLSPEQRALAGIQVERVVRGPLKHRVTLSGVTAADENKTAVISARVGGRIGKLYFKIPGEWIRAGDPLYEIYSEELLASEHAYLAANAGNGAALAGPVEKKLRQWGLTEAQLQTLRASSQVPVSATMYSTLPGTLLETFPVEGHTVAEGGMIYRVADLSSLWVKAQLYPGEMDHLEKGRAEAEIEISGTAVPGRMISVNPELNPGTQILEARFEIGNPGLRFRPGMEAKVTLTLHETAGLWVPRSAVLQDGDGAMVWVRNPEGAFENRSIELGVEDGERLEILSGLSEGDSVATGGASLLAGEWSFKHGGHGAENHAH